MLNINNKREATLFWGFTCREFNTYYPLPNDYKETKQIIYDILLDKHDSEDSLSNTINSLNSICSLYHLNDNDISWFKQNNERLINWIWFTIYNSRDLYTLYKNLNEILNKNNRYAIKIEGIENSENSSRDNIIIKFKLNEKPFSIKEKIDEIIKFIDLIDINSDTKKELITQFKTVWEIIASFDNFKWLDKQNIDLTNWAYVYFSKYIKQKSTFPTVQKDIYINDNYYKFIAEFDLWDTSPESKELFLYKIRKSAAQKKFRTKQVGKKQCSFNLSQKSINQLALLAELQGVPKNHILESLINNKTLELGEKQ